MKSILVITLIALFGLAMPADAGAERSKDAWVCYASNNYRGSMKTIRPGEYTNCSQWRYNSWKTSCAVKLVYYKRNGQKGEKVLKGDVRDLKSQMRGWRDLKYGSRGLWRNIHKAVFYCGGEADKPNTRPGTKPNRPGSAGNYLSYLKKGQCVAFKSANYNQQFKPYQPGRKYSARSLDFQFASMRLPKDYLVMFTYKTRSGRSKEYVCKTDIRDIANIARSWDIRDKRNPWSYIQHFELRKASANQPSTGGGNDNKAYLGKEWYNRYKTGYIVFSEHKYYDGDYEAKPNGDYDYRKLGFHPLSIYVPKSNRYVIMEYKAANGKIKSEVIKKSIHDLDRYLYHLGVHKDYKRTPYKAVKRFAVIRQ